MESYVLYHPKDAFTIVQTADYTKLQHELDIRDIEYETKEWGHTFDQVNTDYVPTIRVNADGKLVDYTVEYFNTHERIVHGHFTDLA